jgi:hypothetical protein
MTMVNIDKTCHGTSRAELCSKKHPVRFDGKYGILKHRMNNNNFPLFRRKVNSFNLKLLVRLATAREGQTPLDF